MPAAKAKKSKAPTFIETTADEVLTRYGTHRTCASFGQPERAVELGRAALSSEDARIAQAVATTVLVLARKGHHASGNALADGVLAVPRPDWAGQSVNEWVAATRAPLALAAFLRGDTTTAATLLDEALAALPVWVTPPASEYAPLLPAADEGSWAAELLLALGREDQARAFFAANKGPGRCAAFEAAARAGDEAKLVLMGRPSAALEGLLAHGHLALFDKYLPAYAALPDHDPAQKHRLTLDRARRDGEPALRVAFEALASSVSPDLSTWDAASRLEGLGRVVTGALAPTLLAAAKRAAPAVWEEWRAWSAMADLAKAGADLAALLAMANTPTARAHAIAALSSVSDAKPVLGLAATLDVADFAPKGPSRAALQSAVCSLFSKGHGAAFKPLLVELATSQKKDAHLVAPLAAAAMLGGDQETGWEVFALVSKPKQALAAGFLRHELAWQKDLNAWRTAAEVWPPDEHQRQTELEALLG